MRAFEIDPDGRHVLKAGIEHDFGVLRSILEGRGGILDGMGSRR